MTAGGVIPPPEKRAAPMGTKRARTTGHMEDVDGVPIIFGINHDGTVRIDISTHLSRPGHGTADLDQAKADEFTRRWFEALRQAGAQAAAEDEVIDATIHAAACANPDCEGECDG